MHFPVGNSTQSINESIIAAPTPNFSGCLIVWLRCVTKAFAFFDSCLQGYHRHMLTTKYTFYNTDAVLTVSQSIRIIYTWEWRRYFNENREDTAIATEITICWITRYAAACEKNVSVVGQSIISTV